jgi:asparagine synthase (glutamine-hydrolysing)
VPPEAAAALTASMAAFDAAQAWREAPGLRLGGRWTAGDPAGGAFAASARLDAPGDLIASLGLDPAEARRLPDEALVAAAWMRWGEACVDHLAGDWAFAAWDGASRRLVLARDHHGTTALHWRREDGLLAFASSLPALAALPGPPPRPDLLKVAQVLAAWPGDGVRTGIEGLQALPPAHLLRADASGVSTRRHWFPERLEPLRLGDEALREACRDVLGAAVRSRLRGAGPVAVALSGGLDSGIVTALAGPLLAAEGRALQALTAVPSHRRPGPAPGRLLDDEGDLAAATAIRAGAAAHVLVRADGWPLLASLERHLALYGVPAHAGANHPWLFALLDAARAGGARTFLTGQQGNATVSFAGEASLVWPALGRGRFREAWRALREAEPGPWQALRRQVLKPLLGPALRAHRRRGLRPWILETALAPAFVRELDLEARMRDAGFDPDFLAPPLSAQLELLGPGANPAGAHWHVLGAAYGLEALDPTADRRVIEFCLRLPGTAYRQGGEGRSLARRAFGGSLPPGVAEARLHGLQSSDLGPRALAERGGLREALDGLRASPLASHVLDLDRMASVLEGLGPERAWVAYDEVGSVLLRGLHAGLFLKGLG